ncbi:hypothetical protein [Paraburkholderia sp.]|uniref:hypothetical protein n=1 Tax=Paraburkholderia sp. TaxID=1926495 RepID=UPI0025FEDCE0|nr:hypothetical protein [Paraburkholderia sp.]
MTTTHLNTFASATNATDAATVLPDQQGTIEAKTQSAQGIFLHAGWRTAGTWLWSRLRALDSVNAFYEPLSTLVGELTSADIPDIRPSYNSGHPPLNSAYYEEYRPLLQASARGVQGYRRSFAADRFGEQPDSEFPALQTYLNSLCETSAGQGKIAVLKFCRSQGRAPWLKAAFPDVMHVGILRNPASQFASGWLLRQQWRNAFFVAAPFRVLGFQQNEPIVRQVIAECGVKLPPVAPTSYDTYAAACDQYAQTVEGSDAWRAFIALWMLCVWRTLKSADLVVDSDLLGQSPDYAAELGARFRASTGLMPDLSATRDLVGEAKRNVRRMSAIDGRVLRPINSAALKFLFKQLDKADPLQADIAETVRKKVALANEIADEWRYY